LSHDAIKAYLKLARSHPEPISDLGTGLRVIRESMQATGALEFPSGHGPQQLHCPNFFSMISKHLVSFRSEWKKHVSRSPIDQWDEPSLEQFVYQLKPAIDEINAIYASAKAKLESENEARAEQVKQSSNGALPTVPARSRS